MAKRVFISFAMEDKHLRDLLVGQKISSSTPFEFDDYSVKKPWDSSWKTNCRLRIRGCAGAIGIITPSTPTADGQLWELKCAVYENKPILLIYGYSDQRPSSTPPEIKGRMIYTWTWDRIAEFINSL
jgi:hypothetical protein